jgi:SAM-dependent methyltransferase
VVLTPAEGGRATGAQALSPAVVWHDLECGAYRADLPLWRELARDACPERDRPILDVGAGTGRVTLDLARAGYRLSALDSDGELLDALRQRARGIPLETIQADARSFELERRDHALCLIPMQTIQLLGGPAERTEFLRRARAHLRPGGLLACAIVTELEPFDSELEGQGPSPETTRIGGALFTSRALSVRVDERHIRIERERTILPGPPAGGGERPSRERDLIELDRLSVTDLRREGLEVGLSEAGLRLVPETEEHVGSSVVIFRA